MIELPDKFKFALGNGIRTSLYPVVNIYKNVRIDEPDTWGESEKIYLSSKETNIDGNAYKPLLLNSPSVRSSADIINNKYTISSVSLSISNASFQGKIFSDDIQSILNAVCQVYYCSNGIDKIDDCLLIYTGTIRRYTQSAESIGLQLEDATQQMLSTKIPATLIPEEGHREEDIGKPYPMVYGNVDKSPVIPNYIPGYEYVSGFELEETNSQLTKLYIDKPNKPIVDLWSEPNQNDYGQDFLTDSHPLVTRGYIKNIGELSIYDDGFFPISRNLNVNDWYYYLNGISNPNAEGYKKIEINTDEVYTFEKETANIPASIVINSKCIINEPEIYGIATRIYRPIDKLEYINFHDFEQGGSNTNSVNRLYGFTELQNYFDGNQTQTWKPWDTANYNDTEIAAYTSSLSTSHFWWQPTGCNQVTSGEQEAFTDIDIDWVTQVHSPDKKGLYPVNNLQDGTYTRGIYISSRNLDGMRGSGNNSGYAAAKLIFKDNIADFTCTSKVVYDAEYHSYAGMSTTGNWDLAYAASFWTGNDAPGEYNGQYHRYADELDQNPGFITEWPNIPNGYGEINQSSWVTQNYSGQSGTEQSIRKEDGFGEASSFNRTNLFRDIKFGVKQVATQGSSPGNDTGYVAIQLFNFYLLQDAVIDDPLNREYYADIKGRLSSTPMNVFCTVEGTGFGNPGTHTITLKFTENFDLILENFSIGDTVNIQAVDGPGGETAPIDSIDEENTTITLLKASGMINVIVGNTYIVEIDVAIRNAPEIMEDILKDELGYLGEFNIPNDFDLFKTDYKFLNDFTLNEQKEAKQVFEGLFKSSLAIPSFNEKGQFKLIPIHQLEIDNWDEYQANGTQAINSNAIDNEHILRYSFSLTKLEDVKNQVNVKYKKNYASGELDKETGYVFYDTDNNEYESYDSQSIANYPDDPSKHYNLDYYGLQLGEAKLEVETEYIRDDLTAKRLQKRLLNWYANQHLIVKLDLPVSYINLEVGDYIHFDELVGGKLAFGYDYTRHYNKNGQVAYKYFFINKISKSLDKISIEGIQVHRGDYGFWGSWDDEYGDNGSGSGFDEGDNSGDVDLGLPDIIEAGIIEEDDLYLNAYWEHLPDNEFNSANINSNPRMVIDTNITGDFDCDIFITWNPEPFEYGISHPPPILPSAPPMFQLTSDYITVHKDYYTNQATGEKQGGIFTFGSQFCPPDEEHGNIVGFISLCHPDLTQCVTLSFFQNYIEDPTEPIFGDINGDGNISVLDVIAAVHCIIYDIDIFSEENNYSPLGDANQDGALDVQDVVILIDIILDNELF
tara:strand:- start:443 stop:4324 length:3882 start_codon:yes stop_codon:yes gene_type:complete